LKAPDNYAISAKKFIIIKNSLDNYNQKMVDNDLQFMYNILKELEADLPRQETYSERVEVRRDIRATKKEIDRRLQANIDSIFY
jgi:hypothetical protein